MNIRKNKVALALSGLLFLSTPFSSAFAHEDHCEIKDTKLGDTMDYMKSELRAYTKSFKSDDTEDMKKHAGELLKLSAIAKDEVPVTIKYMTETPDATDMTAEQKTQYVEYQELMTELQGLFTVLDESSDKEEIEGTLSKIKDQTKKGHKAFRQKCD